MSPKPRKGLLSQLKLLYRSFLLNFLFYWGPQWIGWGPLSHWGGQSASVRLPIQMLISSRKMFDQMSRHSLAYSSWHVKLAITYSYSILKLLLKIFVHLYFMIIFLFLFSHHHLYTTFSIVSPHTHLAFGYWGITNCCQRD